jgi:hypothetical protein
MQRLLFLIPFFPSFFKVMILTKLFTLLQDPKLIGEAYLIATLELFFLTDMGHCTAQDGDRKLRKSKIRKKKTHISAKKLASSNTPKYHQKPAL